MRKKLMLRVLIILFAVSTISFLIGMMGNNNIAKMIGFVLLIIVSILNVGIRFIK